MSQKVLIIEDDKILREALTYKLEKEDFIVTEASDGEEGYQKIVTEVPDVILLDIQMPKMGGIEVLKKMKENSVSAKVIVLTNEEELEPLASALEQDIKGYLIKKDWSIQSVIDKIREVLA